MLVLERRADGQLWARTNGADRPVRVHRCFPWSEPNQFLSLRDSENQEVAMVTHLDELNGESRVALSEALVEAGFVLRVLRNSSRSTKRWRSGPGRWRPSRGPRSFQTKLDDWPWEVPGGRDRDPGRIRRPVSRGRTGGHGREEPEVALGVRGLRERGWELRLPAPFPTYRPSSGQLRPRAWWPPTSPPGSRS